MPQLLRRLLNRIRYRRFHDDLAEELALHRELKAKELAAGGWIRSVLHGVSPTDPIAFIAVAVITLTIAVCAGLIPARRAASVDPAVALRAA